MYFLRNSKIIVQVRKKKAAGDLVLTPVRRSKRNQAKTNIKYDLLRIMA